MFDRYTKTKSIPIPHWNEVIFDNLHNNQIRFIFHWNQVKFDTLHWNQVNLNHTHKMQVSLLTLKSSDFRPAFKNQVNSTTHTTKMISYPHWNKVIFDPPHWNQINSGHPHKNQFNFPADPKNRWFSASIQVTNQFLPPTQQPNQFQRYIKINLSSTPHTEIK